MTAREILYVFTKGPYSNATGLEGLDAAIIGASFEQRVSLLFLQDGVYQLKRGQSTASSQLKQVTKMFSAVFDFGIEAVYAHDQSLTARNLTADDLLVDVAVLDTDALRDLVHRQFRVFTF